MSSLSKHTSLVRIIKRFSSTATLKRSSPSPNWKPKFPPKEDMEFAKTYNLIYPAAHHTNNPYSRPHKQIPYLFEISLVIFIPAIAYFGYKTYLHEKHEEEHIYDIRPPFKPVEYLRIRRTPFPWGDGNHSLFHNPKRNALPTGYEE